MPTSICPECSEEVFVDAESEQGDTIHCDECSSTLVVVGLDPIELDLQDESTSDGPDHDAFGNYDYDDERF